MEDQVEDRFEAGMLVAASFDSAHQFIEIQLSSLGQLLYVLVLPGDLRRHRRIAKSVRLEGRAS